MRESGPISYEARPSGYFQSRVGSTLVESLWEGCHESRRCSRDTYQSHISPSLIVCQDKIDGVAPHAQHLSESSANKPDRARVSPSPCKMCAKGLSQGVIHKSIIMKK